MMKLDLIHPVLPPMIDGIGDYTALLSAELAREHRVRILVDENRTYTPIPNVEIVPAYKLADRDSFNRLEQFARQSDADWIVLQYNPFGYGRRGYNPLLPKVMQRIAAMGKPRLAMMAHENYTPFVNLKLSIMAMYQRPQFRKLLRAAEVTFFSMEKFVGIHRSWAPGRTMIHLPVGSNIPPVPVDRADVRARLGFAPDEVVLGVFGTAHASRLLDLVGHSVRHVQAKGLKVRLLYVGPDGGAFAAQFPGVSCITDGPHPSDEVSRRLAAMDVFLATYVDGISSRRGAFIADLQHGLPIAATVRHNTDPFLVDEGSKAYLLASPDQPEQFAENVAKLATDRALAQSLAAGATALFDRVFSWPRIAQKLIQSLLQVS